MATLCPDRPLPVTRGLTLAGVVSILVALLSAFASIDGLWHSATIYPTKELLRAFPANDLVDLAIVLPALFFSVWRAVRGSLAGLLFWPGALLSALYGHFAVFLCLPLGWRTLADLAVVVFCTYSIAGLVATIDGESVRNRLSGLFPARLSGGILVAFGTLSLVRAAATMGWAVLQAQSLAAPAVALDTADLLIAPAWLIGGVLLWRRKALGYVTGIGLLFQGGVQFVGLIVYMILQPFFGGNVYSVRDVLIVGGMSLIFVVPLVLFVCKLPRT